MSAAAGSSTPAWWSPSYPELRSEPPWVMSEMVVAQRELPRPILSDPAAAELAAAVSGALAAGRGVIVSGCGTSEHAALAICALLSDALGERAQAGAVSAAQAFDAALLPARDGDLVIVVSHEATSAATVAALQAARAAGARTGLITATSVEARHADAELVFRTPLRDASWCHSVGYLSPVLAGAAIAAALSGVGVDPVALSAGLAACDDALAGVAPSVEGLARRARLLAIGSGVDAISASEQALKVEEGAWIPTSCLHLETLLHGHLPATGADTGVIAFLLDPRGFEQRATRTLQALRAAGCVGMTSLLVTDEHGAALVADQAEAVVVLPAPAAAGPLGALLAGAIALQRITLACAGLRGTNPDLLRRDDERYRSAAQQGAHKLGGFGAAP